MPKIRFAPGSEVRIDPTEMQIVIEYSAMKSRNVADMPGSVEKGDCNLGVANKASWKIRGNGATQGYMAIRNPGVYLIKSNPLLAYPLAYPVKATPRSPAKKTRVCAFATYFVPQRNYAA